MQAMRMKKAIDNSMRDTFWVGVYPGMTEEKIEFIIQRIKDFVREM